MTTVKASLGHATVIMHIAAHVDTVCTLMNLLHVNKATRNFLVTPKIIRQLQGAVCRRIEIKGDEHVSLFTYNLPDGSLCGFRNDTFATEMPCRRKGYLFDVYERRLRLFIDYRGNLLGLSLSAGLYAERTVYVKCYRDVTVEGRCTLKNLKLSNYLLPSIDQKLRALITDAERILADFAECESLSYSSYKYYDICVPNSSLFPALVVPCERCGSGDALAPVDDNVECYVHRIMKDDEFTEISNGPIPHEGTARLVTEEMLATNKWYVCL